LSVPFSSSGRAAPQALSEETVASQETGAKSLEFPTTRSNQMLRAWRNCKGKGILSVNN